MEISILLLIIAGALGGFMKDILEDGALQLPKIKDGKFYLGFLGGMVTGAAAGYFVDGNPITAFLGGYTGRSAFEFILTKSDSKNQTNQQINEAIIRKVAGQECVDPDLAVRVAKCESQLDETATHLNDDGSRDVGLFQINSIYHPEVSEDQALNAEFAARFFCKAFKAGHLDWWNATKTCWN